MVSVSGILMAGGEPDHDATIAVNSLPKGIAWRMVRRCRRGLSTSDPKPMALVPKPESPNLSTKVVEYLMVTLSHPKATPTGASPSIRLPSLT